ncbi:chloride channel protein ClC-Kb-like isoform X2 [Onychostruthus taczanowskii]|uniref:chloride channel protein ClC-Kb-like isoform X2 n=1 Tax=Onychostruthus taczanowskii TaxID=356909 RepID=UPI001B80525F|nr:chloride channel protein ClC-Kb-like isoform X2 [Onychostruthus taczanowskii]
MERPVPGGLRGEKEEEKEEERVLVSEHNWRPCPTARRRVRAHMWLYQEIGDIGVLKFLSWTLFPMALAAFSTGFSQSITPHSGGSGIPELKTILMGVVLEDYLAIQNFGAKVVGLTCTLTCGSTIFLGKVGPYVHLSAMAAAYLGKMRTTVTREYENKFKQHEMLVAAQAVGVATVFGAPISGKDPPNPTLGTPKPRPDPSSRFSRGAFQHRGDVPPLCRAGLLARFLRRHLRRLHVSAPGRVQQRARQGRAGRMCPLFPFTLPQDLFGVLISKPTLSFLSPLPETIAAVFKSDLKIDFPFDLLETFFFLILGAICGIVACAYLFCQRWMMVAVKRNRLTAKLLATDKPVYTVLVVLLLASITFPPGLGQFMASRLTMKELLISLFDNRTWSVLAANTSGVAKPGGLWQEWDHPSATIYGTLTFFLLMKVTMAPQSLGVPPNMVSPWGDPRCAPPVLDADPGHHPAPASRVLHAHLHLWSSHRAPGGGGGGPALPTGAPFRTPTAHYSCWLRPGWRSRVLGLGDPRGVHGPAGVRGHRVPGPRPAHRAGRAGGQRHQPEEPTVLLRRQHHRQEAALPAPHPQPAHRVSPRPKPHVLGAFSGKQWKFGGFVFSSSYRVVVEEFMERQVVALAKGDGFQEVLLALDATADAEYPVVESTGSPTLVGTISRSQLVTFLQSHKHPQAPQEEKLATVGTLGDDCAIEPIMLQFSPWTSLHQVYHLFQLLKLQRVFVTRSGELVGAVSRAELQRAIEDLANPK